MNLDDTIVAVSSPSGAACRGIVRLSGAQAIDIAQSIFSHFGRHDLHAITGTCRLGGIICIENGRLPASAIVFRAPRSYTRQDLVEFHLLGAPVVLGLLVEACLAAGARRAEPGEFTARAFLSGALDLSQVHGIAGMIAARSDLQLAAAARLLHGQLARTADQARETLADLISLVEGALDFADEPIEFITPGELKRRLTETLEALHATASAGLRAERWNELPRVLLAGKPNVGKSSLLNRLTGIDRAICTPVAGTTRDAISAPMATDDLECLLVDVAGLDDAMNELDAEAQRAARREVEHADLVLRVCDARDFDSQRPTSDAAPACDGTNESARQSTLVVLNKSDLLTETVRRHLLERRTTGEPDAYCIVSAATGEGCDDLKTRILAALQNRHIDARDDVIALLTEHRDALQEAIDAIGRAIRLVDAAGASLADADLVAAELHLAAEALGRLVGRDDTEALLGRIFSRFCVGK